jgi:hypothetical protein
MLRDGSQVRVISDDSKSPGEPAATGDQGGSE